jgi:leucine-rich repeat protein SHOC2
VPPQIFKLPKLKVLRLDANPFISPVAELKKLSAITTLSSLNFSANKVSDFPGELLKLTNLCELDLGYGTIKNLPADIDKLKSLKRLVLTKNLITSFPPAFFKLPNLENLDLSYNDFKTLQPEFTNLGLRALDVSFNRSLSTIPAIKDMRYINVKSTKTDIEKLKWSLGEGCMIMN